MTVLNPGEVVHSPTYLNITAFISEYESWEGEDAHVRTTGEYGTLSRISLRTTELRKILREWDSLAQQLEDLRVEKARGAQINSDLRATIAELRAQR